MMGYYGNGGWLGFGLGWVFMIFWWAVVVFGIVVFVRWLRHYHHEGAEKTALQVLEERYAKGEISREEFLNMKNDLKS